MKIWLMALALILPAGGAAAQDGAALASSSSEAAAVCVLPADPPGAFAAPVMAPRPVAPPCLNLAAHTTTCSKKVLDKYNTEIDARNGSLKALIDGINAYQKAMDAYTNAAMTYHNCQMHAAQVQFDALNGSSDD